MKHLKWLPLVVLGALAGLFWKGLSLDPHRLPSTHIGKTIADFDLPALSETGKHRFSSRELKGKVVLLNVWASWCKACEEEQLFLLDLASKGFPIFGLNYKDEDKAAKDWLSEWGNPYQKIAQDKLGTTAIDLGIYGTPETFLIDEKGTIIYRHVGVLNQDIWVQTFEPLLKQLRAHS